MGDALLRVAITTRAIAPWHGRGGLERHVADLVRHLAARHVQVTLIAPPPRPESPQTLDVPADALAPRTIAVPYLTFPGAGRRGTTILDRDTAYPLFGVRAGRAAARLARAGEVDIVHGLGASVLGYAAARRAGPHLPPLVLNPQGLEEFGATDPERAGFKVTAYWPLQRAVRACARAADVVLATDRALVPVVVRHLDLDPARVPVIPNAVDLARCDGLAGPADGRDFRGRMDIAPETTLLVSVGRLERNKGFHVLVAALARLKDAGDWRWVLAGRGPFEATLRRLAHEAGLGSRMIALDSPGDAVLHAAYEAADLFVHPTLYEGSSLVTLEAMAHRRPVVASRAGGLPDKVVHGTTGWLVTPGDADALSSTLVEAIAARHRWRAMGDAGRRLAEDEFGWPAVTSRLIDLYQDLLARGRRPSGLS